MNRVNFCGTDPFFSLKAKVTRLSTPRPMNGTKSVPARRPARCLIRYPGCADQKAEFQRRPLRMPRWQQHQARHHAHSSTLKSHI